MRKLLRRGVFAGVAVASALVGSLFSSTPAFAWSGAPLMNWGKNDAPGYCLDANRNSWYNNFSRVQVWRCNGWSNQQWWANWGSKWTEIRTPGPPEGPAKCLDAWPDSTKIWGYRVSTFDCNGGTQQKWDVSEMYRAGAYHIRSIRFNLCLDVPWPWNMTNGSSVGLYPCDEYGNTESQNWGRF